MGILKPGNKVRHPKIQSEIIVVSATWSVGAVNFSTGGGDAAPDSGLPVYSLLFPTLLFSSTYFSLPR